MKHRSDIDRVLETWMADGPNAISDRVVEVVATRIGVQRQRRAWPFQGRTPMAPLKLAAAIAAVAIIAVVGYNLLPGTFGPGTPTTEPTPTASPSVASEIPLSEGPLTAGRYLFRLSTAMSITIEADVPAGWQGVPTYAVTRPSGQLAPRGVAVVFMLADGLHSDPCHWDREGNGRSEQPGDVQVGPAAIDLVNALQANSSYTSTAPSPITLGAYQGYEIEIQRPADVDLAECNSGIVSSPEGGQYQVFAGPAIHPYLESRSNRIHLFIMDVEATRVIAAIRYFDDTPPADYDAARFIVDSVEFRP